MITKLNNYLKDRVYVVTSVIVLLTIITLLLTLLPVQNAFAGEILSYDKLGHLLIFGSWTFLIGYYRQLTKPKDVNLFAIFFLGVCFGVIIEALQYIMPFGRSAEFYDVVFDALGCFIAVLALYPFTEK